MASTLSEVLRAIQPRPRAHECTEACGTRHKTVSPSTRRRGKTGAPHTRKGPFRDSRGDLLLWHTTQAAPWVLRAQRRKANKRARQSRKANR